MFKKLLIVSAILATSSSMVFAGSYKGEKDYKGEMAAPCPMNVFASGPYIGFSVGDRTNYTGGPVVFKGFDGNLSLGYGGVMNAFYLAGEIFGIGTLKVKDFTNSTTTTNTVSAKSNWGYGASILPGYLITDTVIGYLRGSVINSRFNRQNVNKTGWQIGLGGQTTIVQNWDIRGEYLFTSYGSVSKIGNTYSDQANIGIVYKFL